MSRSLLAAASAALLSAASAHAAITVEGHTSDVTLVITEASGSQSIFPGGLQAQGDALWHPALTMLYESQYVSGDNATLASSTPLSTNGGSSVLTSTLPIGLVQTHANIADGMLSTDFNYVSPTYTSEQLARLQTATTDDELYDLSFNTSAVGAVQAALIGSPDVLATGVIPPTHGGFWLAPGAQATLSGTLSLKASVSTDELISQPAGATMRAYTLADTVAQLTLVGDGGDVFGDALLPAEMQPFAFVEHRIYWFDEVTGGADTSPLSTDQTEAFSLSVTNTSSQGLWLLTMMGSSTYSLQRFMAAPAGPIPEPGTWALMGLGLVGIAAASARQRQRDLV